MNNVKKKKKNEHYKGKTCEVNSIIAAKSIHH